MRRGALQLLGCPVPFRLRSCIVRVVIGLPPHPLAATVIDGPRMTSSKNILGIEDGEQTFELAWTTPAGAGEWSIALRNAITNAPPRPSSNNLLKPNDKKKGALGAFISLGKRGSAAAMRSAEPA